MGTGGIPTTDNIPETTEIFGFPTDNKPDKFISIYFKVKCQSKFKIYMQDYMQDY
jgi:hypothetical protein